MTDLIKQLSKKDDLSRAFPWSNTGWTSVSMPTTNARNTT